VYYALVLIEKKNEDKKDKKKKNMSRKCLVAWK